jgi:WD40 repeat protein
MPLPFHENHNPVQEQLNRLNNESGTAAAAATTKLEKENERPSEFSFDTESNNNKKLKAKLTSSGSKAGIKIRGQASRIVSSFKTQAISCSLVREFIGHHDGIWEVACSPTQELVATASADHTACIWSIESGKCLLKYDGHTGSVNSIKFHPSKELMLTASGDNSAHIWHGAVNIETLSSRRGASSEEELEDDDDFHPEENERIDTLRTPLQDFSHNGHSSVVVAADWISTSSDQSPTQIITASWDRTAILWDIETKAAIQTLTGHDNELTHCSSHARLVVTSSRDSTFRLWDFRYDE